MPNWCNNLLLVYGSDADLREFAHRAGRQDDPTEIATGVSPQFSLSFDAPVSTPNPLAAEQHPTAWCRQHGGTWRDTALGDITAAQRIGRLRYSFYTAWTPPEAWLAEAAQQFPHLTFVLRYNEPRMCFAGLSRWSNGDLAADWYTQDSREYEAFADWVPGEKDTSGTSFSANFMN